MHFLYADNENIFLIASIIGKLFFFSFLAYTVTYTQNVVAQVAAMIGATGATCNYQCTQVRKMWDDP